MVLISLVMIADGRNLDRVSQLLWTIEIAQSQCFLFHGERIVSRVSEVELFEFMLRCDTMPTAKSLSCCSAEMMSVQDDDNITFQRMTIVCLQHSIHRKI